MIKALFLNTVIQIKHSFSQDETDENSDEKDEIPDKKDKKEEKKCKVS